MDSWPSAAAQPMRPCGFEPIVASPFRRSTFEGAALAQGWGVALSAFCDANRQGALATRLHHPKSRASDTNDMALVKAKHNRWDLPAIRPGLAAQELLGGSCWRLEKGSVLSEIDRRGVGVPGPLNLGVG